MYRGNHYTTKSCIFGSQYTYLQCIPFSLELLVQVFGAKKILYTSVSPSEPYDVRILQLHHIHSVYLLV